MDRIFQHYRGKIDGIIGAKFTSVKAFVTSEDQDVILLWMFNERTKIWYRVFIDGVYCGIDAYSTDNSKDDLDDHIEVIDYSHWFKEKELTNATVQSGTANEFHISMELEFNDRSVMSMYCLSEEGDCKLLFDSRK